MALPQTLLIMPGSRVNSGTAIHHLTFPDVALCTRARHCVLDKARRCVWVFNEEVPLTVSPSRYASKRRGATAVAISGAIRLQKKTSCGWHRAHPQAVGAQRLETERGASSGGAVYGGGMTPRGLKLDRRRARARGPAYRRSEATVAGSKIGRSKSSS